MCEIFSASIPETAGFASVDPVAGLPEWSVDRQGQVAIYKITHNLHLTQPQEQLKVFVYSTYQTPLEGNTEIYNKSANVLAHESDYFLIQTLETRTSRPVSYENAGPFAFVAVLVE